MSGLINNIAFNIAYGEREYLIDIFYGLTKALGVDIELKFGTDRAGDIKHSNADITKVRGEGMNRSGALSEELRLRLSGIRRICKDYIEK
jgi:hypothetical protein